MKWECCEITSARSRTEYGLTKVAATLAILLASPQGRNNYRTAAAPAASARGPRIRASNSAVGQESAGRPYLICIALTALRLCWPITPSTLPTLKPARTSSCCNSRSSLNGSCATGAGGPTHRRRARDAGGEIARGGRIDQRVVPLGVGGEIRIGQKRRPGAAHRQQQRGRQIVVRQRLAVGIGDAELRPFRTRQLDGQIGLVPRAGSAARALPAATVRRAAISGRWRCSSRSSRSRRPGCAADCAGRRRRNRPRS